MNALPRVIVSLSSLVLVGGGVLLALPAQTPRPACTIAGRVVNSGTALPGVSVTATRDGQVVAATSTDMNGAYRLRIPEGEFVVAAELAAFARFEQALTVSTESCEVPLDVQLVLASRAQAASGQAVRSRHRSPQFASQAESAWGQRGAASRAAALLAVAARSVERRRGRGQLVDLD